MLLLREKARNCLHPLWPRHSLLLDRFRLLRRLPPPALRPSPVRRARAAPCRGPHLPPIQQGLRALLVLGLLLPRGSRRGGARPRHLPSQPAQPRVKCSPGETPPLPPLAHRTRSARGGLARARPQGRRTPSGPPAPGSGPRPATTHLCPRLDRTEYGTGRVRDLAPGRQHSVGNTHRENGALPHGAAPPAPLSPVHRRKCYGRPERRDCGPRTLACSHRHMRSSSNWHSMVPSPSLSARARNHHCQPC